MIQKNGLKIFCTLAGIGYDNSRQSCINVSQSCFFLPDRFRTGSFLSAFNTKIIAANTERKLKMSNTMNGKSILDKLILSFLVANN